MKKVKVWGYGWVNTSCTSRGRYHWLEHGYPVDDSTKSYPALEGYVFDRNEILAKACAKCLSKKRAYLRTYDGQIERLQMLLKRMDVLY